MFLARTLETQLADSADDPLRVLVVGAGVAGTTAAQLLRRDGLHPVLVERADPTGDRGYMLALMPMVDAAVEDLAVTQAYRAASVPLDRYRVLSHVGRTLREDSLGALMSRYGDYRGLSRSALLEVLTSGGCPVTTGATVAELAEDRSGVHVTIRDDGGSHHARFDLVVVADGIGSSTRQLLPDVGTSRTVTGWGGWVVWAEQDGEPDLVEELWGDGFFAGSYPVRGAVGAFVGAAVRDTARGRQELVSEIRRRLRSGTARLDRVLDAVGEADSPFFWVLDDVRSTSWSHGRTVLLGDAAAGFLPTAGIGAAMAVESAWVLARTVSGATPDTVTGLLHAFEAAQRPRVEAAQANSRSLARLMFSSSTLLAHARNTAMRVTSVDVALRPIRALLEHPAQAPVAAGTRRSS